MVRFRLQVVPADNVNVTVLWHYGRVVSTISREYGPVTDMVAAI